MITWLKLDVNIMDDEKILVLLSRSDGAKFLQLWIHILCLAMKSKIPGVLLISDKIPYTPESLAARTRLDRSTVEKAIELFQEFEMIYIDNGYVCVTNFEKHQNLERIEKQRALSRKTSQTYRDKNRKLLSDASRDRHVTSE